MKRVRCHRQLQEIPPCKAVIRPPCRAGTCSDMCCCHKLHFWSVCVDPDYQAFVRSLEEGPTILPSATAQLEAREAEAKAAGGSAPGIIITPLMEFLQKKYQSMPFKRGSKSRRKDRLEVVEEVCVAGFWCKILVV